MYLNTVPQLVLLFKVRGPLECEALLGTGFENSWPAPFTVSLLCFLCVTKI